jgi:hypothetical protein
MLFFSTDVFAQEMSNEKYQKIIVMDHENEGWLDVFVDPTNFDCKCDDVIQLSLKPTATKNVYKTEDGLVTLTIKNNAYIFTVGGKQNCCYIKPGQYTI